MSATTIKTGTRDSKIQDGENGDVLMNPGGEEPFKLNQIVQS